MFLSLVRFGAVSDPSHALHVGTYQRLRRSRNRPLRSHLELSEEAVRPEDYCRARSSPPCWRDSKCLLCARSGHWIAAYKQTPSGAVGLGVPIGPNTLHLRASLYDLRAAAAASASSAEISSTARWIGTAFMNPLLGLTVRSGTGSSPPSARGLMTGMARS